MAVVMEMVWSGIETSHYDAARERVRWEEEIPEGAVFHVAWMADDGMHVVDVWESEDAFNKFAEQRLMPVVKGELDTPGEPTVKFSKAHRFFDALHRHARS
jgi:hypothetical protein